MQFRAGASVLAGLLVFLSVFTGPVAATAGGPTSPAADVSAGPVASANHTPPDPDTDVLGWEAGYWHNESIPVNQTDGLSEAEREAYVARAMARVEYLRDREFKAWVPVEVIPRDKYQNQTVNNSRGGNHSAWNNQVWEALFIVGDDKDVQAEIETVFGTSVVGFYSPEDDEIKIITENPDEPVLDNATLIHELVHALQDQYFNLSQPQYRGSTQDRQLAANGLVEGEANYIEAQYADRCGTEWACVESPEQVGGSGGSQPNLGILLAVLQPYSDGPVYIDTLLAAGGWDAVDTTFEDPPVSTEQVIHRIDEEPVSIGFEHESRNGWTSFPSQGENGSDTVGEASFYAMFWYQAREYRASTINPNSLFRNIDSEYDTYNYAAQPSAGWGNDRVFPYRQSVDDETRYAYVWVTEWDTVKDAEEFHDTYRQILIAHNAERSGERTWVIDSGPYADSFRVVQSGTRVTIVNGPTVEDLADIRPSIEYQPVQTPTDTPTPTPPGTTTERGETPTRTLPTTITPGQPGFGIGVALIGLAAGLLWRRRG